MIFAALPAIRGDHKMLRFKLCFSCAFRLRARRQVHSNQGKRSVFAAAAKPLITLLNFAAGQKMELRIVAIVTILQQAVTVRPALPERSGSSGRRVRYESYESHGHFTGAESLGKRWRFFATYAEVQSSPLLRHPLSPA